MSFADAIRSLNGLKRRKVIRDYALMGAVAATRYVEPVFTEDLDIIVLVDSDEEYVDTFGRVAELSEGTEGMHVILGGTPVQMFPTTTKPLYRDAYGDARAARVGNLRVKVSAPEHLILLCLEAFRERDRFRIHQLLVVANRRHLETLLGRFDDAEDTLTRRLETIR